MAIYTDDNSWRPANDTRFFPAPVNPKALDDNKTIADHLRRGDANYGAYPAEAHPLLANAFKHWNEMWEALFTAGATEEMEFAAGKCVSAAWRIYLGRCVRWIDVDFDGSLGPDHPLAHLFASGRDDHRWWFTEDGYKQALSWIAEGKWSA